MAKSKIPLVALMLILLGITVISPVAATPEEAKWSRVNLPTEGEAGNWVLANGSDIQHLTMATDGTIYTYATPSATSYTLFKSTDGGWAPVGKVKDAIIALALAPDRADIIYYATSADVYKSADAGLTFTRWPPNPGGAGSGNITITAIDIARKGSSYLVAVGTRDADNAQFGGVYLLDENKPFTGWVNTNIGNYDVAGLAFSPNTDRQLVAIVTDETDTLITSRIDDGGWGRATGNATIKGRVARTAAIAFPDDYNATAQDATLFVAINTGSNQGDVYQIDGAPAPESSRATDLDVGAIYNLSNLDISGLAVSGNTTTTYLLAGAANSTQVYLSTDSGTNWKRSSKKPTGQRDTYLLMAPDFTTSRLAYAATSGTDSAFSITSDGGATWHQVGLIDTAISTIVDLAPSPNYAEDNTLFMLTFGGTHSLWRSLNSGTKWERVLTSTLAGADSLSQVELSPQYGKGSQIVFLAGTTGSNSMLWKLTDQGQTFSLRSAPFPIDAWTIANDDTLFLSSYNGSQGLVYGTTDGGFSYSSGAVAGNHPLRSIVLSPSYEQDRSLLVGNSQGWVYWSQDKGNSFKLLGQQLPLSSTSFGKVSVAFDTEFSSNQTVYAASDVTATTGNKKRIYRFTIGKSDTWESIDGTLPAGSILNQLTVSASRVLYSANSQPVDTASGKGGMERSLNPTYSLTPTFETVTRGLDDGATLTGLWLQGSQAWSIDIQNTRLMTYIDSLARPVTLTSPDNKATVINASNVNLDWEVLKGTTKYQWQVDDDTSFAADPTQFEGETQASSARLPALEMATTYYWRVRATEPALSQWSAKWSFTTGLGTESHLGFTVNAPELYSPQAGAAGTPRKPLFQWSALTEAERYELLVATDASFSNPIIIKIGDYTLFATAWQSDINLDYTTTYYWKVRAISPNSYSAWSAVGAFTTESAPLEPSPSPEPASPTPSPSPPPPSPPPPASPAQSTLPDWAIYLIGALLLTTVLLLITLLVLVTGIRRS